MTNTNIELTTSITHSDSQVFADMDGEVVMMSVEKGNYYNLDNIASRIWTLIEQPITVNALCDNLVQEFEVERDTCVQDVLPFLQELQKDNLIKIV